MLKKQQVRLATLSVVFVLGIILAACSSGSSLIGKWEASDETLGMSFVFEFKTDGTLGMSIEGMSIEGTYEMVDADTFNMTISMLGQSQTTPVDFVRAGNELTLTIEGSPQVFTKIP